MPEFNLIEEPWIPCIDLEGKQVEYGISETLLRAHELGEICDDSPLVTVAIHRLLLAILYRVFEGPSETRQWKKLFLADAFPDDDALGVYFAKWHDRFFLFDGSHPFMQVAGLDLNEYKLDGKVKNAKSDGMMRLSKEAPDKGGRILFDHRMGNEKPDYEPKQIAKMILAAQSYAGTGVASGGKIGIEEIKPSACQFAPCVDGLILWLQGDSLFQTLMLNLVPHEVCPSDLPAWEDNNIVRSAINSWSSGISFTGPIQRFASLSRFIRAENKKSIFFTNGVKTATDSNDPMKAYYRAADDMPYVASKLLEHKAAWRDANTLFAVGVGNRKPPECLNFAARMTGSGVAAHGAQYRANVVGLATKQDKGLLWRHERMPVPLALLNDLNMVERLGIVLKSAEQGASELYDRTKRIAKLYLAPTAENDNGRKPDDKDIAKMIEYLDPRPAYWARLERHFFDLLERIPNDWDRANGQWKPDDEQAATNAWREQVKREAERALQESTRSLGTTARAIQSVARVRTDFDDNDLNPPAQKAARVKGKDKKK